MSRAQVLQVQELGQLLRLQRLCVDEVPDVCLDGRKLVGVDDPWSGQHPRTQLNHLPVLASLQNINYVIRKLILIKIYMLIVVSLFVFDKTMGVVRKLFLIAYI